VLRPRRAPRPRRHRGRRRGSAADRAGAGGVRPRGGRQFLRPRSRVAVPLHDARAHRPGSRP